ncbi:MAG: hypothetical protein ACREMB_22115 [Candidatus Rokuibacteriota bacterium]
MSSDLGPTRLRWLIVVQHAHRDLYEVLRERFQSLGVVVVLDRRRAERRQGGAGLGVERRRTERRQRRPIAWVYPSQPADVLGPDVGRLDLTAGPVPGAEATPLVEKTCPECAMAVEFEMPRFSEPPARVETAVVHRTDQTFGVQHYVDVRAFTEAGGAMARQRIQAQRRTPRR